MRDENRIEPLLEELSEYWHRNPDLRLSQIICNAAIVKHLGNDPYYLEDNVLLELLAHNNKNNY